MTMENFQIRLIVVLSLESHHTKLYFSPNHRKYFSSLHDIGQVIKNKFNQSRPSSAKKLYLS